MRATFLSHLQFGIWLIATTLFILLLMTTPSLAAAQSLQQQIKTLQQEVNTLQQSLLQRSAGASSAASSVSASEIPNVSLGIGDSSPAVKKLQKALNRVLDEPVAASGPGSLGQETSFFGPKTRAAVERFQAQYADEVLAPVGLTEPTGFFGSQTHQKLSKLLTTTSDTTVSSAINQPTWESTENSSQEIQTEVEKLESQITFDKWELTPADKQHIVASVPPELRAQYFPEYVSGNQSTGSETDQQTNPLRQEYERRLQRQSSGIEQLRSWAFLQSLTQPGRLLKLSLAAVFGQPETAQAQNIFLFGGRIASVTPCTCNVLPAFQVTIAGVRPANVVYFPGVSQARPSPPPRSGVSTLGNYEPFGICLQPIGSGCTVTATGSIIIIGMSGLI